jgi:cell division protein FtsL
MVLVKYLTKQEQIVLCLILALVLAGWAVKVYRTAHPARPAVWKQKS